MYGEDALEERLHPELSHQLHEYCMILNTICIRSCPLGGKGAFYFEIGNDSSTVLRTLEIL